MRLLLVGVGGVVLQRLEDGFGDGWADGQMGALGVEAGLVGGVGDGVQLAVRGHELVGALDDSGLVLGALVHNITLLLSLDLVLGLVAGNRTVQKYILIS